LFSGIFKLVSQHFRNHAQKYFILFIAFVVGVSAGAFTVNGLSNLQRQQLSHYLSNFFSLMDKQPFIPGDIFKLSLTQNIKIIGVMMLLGLSIIGAPFIFVVVCIRGFITGFTAGFIIQTYNIKGMIFILISVVPKELIIVPAFIAIGVNGINFSLDIINKRTSMKSLGTSYKSNIASYCFVTLFYSAFIILGIIIESYILPIIVRIFLPMMII